MIEMKQGLYYFAHPYSAKTEEGRIANYELCCIRSGKLLLKGYNIFSPITHSHPIESMCFELSKLAEEERWQFWLDIDLAILEFVNFTGVILAPQWAESKGCQREYKWFKENHRSNGQPYEILKYYQIVKGLP